MSFSSPSPRIAVVDVETTGLNAAGGDRVCEIGIVCAEGEHIVDTFQSLVNPQRPLSPGAARVNGLSDAMLRGQPLFASLAQEVLQRVNGAIVVCHNAPFDLSFLEAEFDRLGLAFAPAGIADTLVMARGRSGFGSHSLRAVAARLGIRQGHAHRALDDALTTFQIYCALMGAAGYDLPEVTARPYFAFGVEEELLPPAIQDALAQHKPLTITYVDAKGEETLRTITPLRIVLMNGGPCLRAFCHLRQEERSFRLDRIAVIHD